MEQIIRIPSVESWRLAMGALSIIFIAIVVTGVGASQYLAALFFGGIAGTNEPLDIVRDYLIIDFFL